MREMQPYLHEKESFLAALPAALPVALPVALVVVLGILRRVDFPLPSLRSVDRLQGLTTAWLS